MRETRAWPFWTENKKKIRARKKRETPRRPNEILRAIKRLILFNFFQWNYFEMKLAAAKEAGTKKNIVEQMDYYMARMGDDGEGGGGRKGGWGGARYSR